jgi:hypothetical protein
VLHLDIIKVLYSPTDAQVNCLKNIFKIGIKTAPTGFGAISIVWRRINALPDDGDCTESALMRSLMMVVAPKPVGAVLMPILMSILTL